MILTGPTQQQWMREKGYLLFLRKPVRATSLLVTLSQAIDKLDRYERSEREKLAKFEKLEKFERPGAEKPRLGPAHILRKGSIDINMMGNRSLNLSSQFRRSSVIDHMVADARKKTNNLMMPGNAIIVSSDNNNIKQSSSSNNMGNKVNMYSRRQSLVSSWENVRFEEEETEEQDSFYTGIDGLEVLVVEGSFFFFFLYIYINVIYFFIDNPINQKVLKRVSKKKKKLK